MTEIFKNILRDRGLSEAMIEKCAAEFSGMVLLALIGGAEEILNDDDKESIHEFLDQDNFDAVFHLLESKFSTSGWEQVIEKEVMPLVESYLKEVVKG